MSEGARRLSGCTIPGTSSALSPTGHCIGPGCRPTFSASPTSARTVTLDDRLLQAERRCTVAHEVEHIRLGPVPADPVLAAREEAAIDRAVARKLIGIRELGDALAWASGLAEAAQELWVDEDTLAARLRHLHPAEVHYLRRRLQHVPSG